MFCVPPSRLLTQACASHARRSFFSFGGSPAPAQPTNPNSKLRKRGSINVYSEHKTFNYTPRQLYAVIADVDSYKQFVPFATDSRVLVAQRVGTKPGEGECRRLAKEQAWLGSEVEGEEWEMKAELRIGALNFNEAYTSRVRTRNWDTVTAVADDSTIFKHLATTWQFTPIAPAGSGRAQTKVELQIEYEFASVLHSIAASAVWDKVSSRMVGAFEDRVKAVHGA